MLLKSYRVTNYRNIDDSGDIPVDSKVTCLVGKNESGKTNLLQALRRIRPVDGVEFDVVKDYPRKRYSSYERRVKKTEERDRVLTVDFELEEQDVAAVNRAFGPCVQVGHTIQYSMNYANQRFVTLEVDEQAFLQHKLKSASLPSSIDDKAKSAQGLDSLLEVLGEVSSEESVAKLLTDLSAIKKRGVGLSVWDTVLSKRCPDFMYFDDYRLMAGTASIQDLACKETVEENEHLQTLVELLELAGVTPESLMEDENYEHHKAKIESIANEITEDVFEYWKQNTDLEVEFDVHRKANQNVSPDFHVRIKNTRHKVTVPFDERSKGFVWFFSFMTAFRRLAEENTRTVILLDEPGLSLHASAQADLLQFIEDRLAPDHQVIYTTHSPFMLDSTKLLRVRTVEDTVDKGAIVRADCFGADAVTVFPLQAALSYSLAQTLFLGPDCLLVEGPSDLVYLQVFSELLASKGRTQLDPRWVVTPVGGAGKLSTFASLIGANQLNVAVLMDFSKRDQQLLDNLQKEGFLEQKKVVLYKTFTGGKEADVEDLFTDKTYLQMVKLAYPKLASKLTLKKLGKHPRMVERVSKAFEAEGQTGFSHFAVSKAAATALGEDVSVEEETLGRFEELFIHLNGLLS